MAKKLGQLEALLFACVQMRNLRTVQTGDLTGPLRICAELAHRLRN